MKGLNISVFEDPSFGAPFTGNPCEYSHKLYISRN